MSLHKHRISHVTPRQSLDRLVLFSAFIVGAVGTVILHMVGVPPLFAAAFSAIVLISYAFVAYHHKKMALEAEVIGDNSYYLGFLFTLTSLSVTLYQLADAGGEVSFLRGVIAGFGVALSSTIIGVFLRTFMMQLRTDVVTRERQSRIELSEAARSLRTQLTDCIVHMKSFSTEAIQLSGETHAKILRANEDFHEAQRELFATSSDQYRGVLSQVLRDACDQMGKELHASMQKLIEQVRKEMELTLGNLRKVVTESVTLQQTEVAAQQLRMRRLADEAKHSTKIAGVWSSTVQQLSVDIGQNVEQVRSVTQQMSTHFTEAAGEVELAVKATRRAITAQRLDKAFDKPIAGLETAAQRLEQVVDGLAQAAGRIATDASQHNDRVKTNAELLTSRLHEATASAQAVINDLHETHQLAKDQTHSVPAGAQESEPRILHGVADNNGPHSSNAALLRMGAAEGSEPPTRKPFIFPAAKAKEAARADAPNDAHLVQTER